LEFLKDPQKHFKKMAALTATGKSYSFEQSQSTPSNNKSSTA